MKSNYLKAGFFPAFLITLVLTGTVWAEQVKGIWVVRTSITTPEKVERVLNFAQMHGYTDLFVQVRGRGDAYYTSRIVPRTTYIPSAVYDPLADVVAGAHARGIKVHAWINVYLAWSARTLPADPRHVVNLHPDWVETNSKGVSDPELIAGNGRNGREGIYLSPLHPEVHNHLLAVAEEIVTQYNVDGLHLDYVRYQDRNWGYNRTARKRFLMQNSVDPITLGNQNGSYWYRMDEEEKAAYWQRWNQFRQDAISEFVRSLDLMLEAKAPGVLLSAAVKPNPGLAQTRFFQDWPGWLRRGWMDMVVPMNYSKEVNDFKNNLYLIDQEALDRDQIYMGIATYNQASSKAAEKIIRAYQAGYNDIVIFSFDTYEKNPRYFDDLHRVLK